MKRLLAIDVGNTHTALAVFEDTDPRHHWRIASDARRTTDELWILTESCLRSAGLAAADLHAIGISSVVPALTGRYRELCEQRLQLTPTIVTLDAVPKLKIHYKPPQAVGADRICNAVAGISKYGAPLIIIDLGTATVFDVIDKSGAYAGGLIAPGLNTAADSLHQMTAVLPRVDLEFPKSVVGTSTIESIQSGVLYGAIEMIDGIVRRIQKSLPAPARVIATGGLSGLLVSRSRTIEAVEADLVLEGIRLIVENS